MAENIAVTPGTGATIATDEVVIAGNTVQVQRIKTGFGPDGSWTADTSLINPFPTTDQTREGYIFSTTFVANTAAVRTTQVDIFNASGSGIKLRVVGAYIIIPSAAVTGVPMTWEIIRTSSVGTGGTTLTAALCDTNNTALPVGITGRTKPTGGAATSTTFFYPTGSSEETSNYALQSSSINHILRPIMINETQGLKIDQTTNSAVGTTNYVIIFERVV